LKVIITNYPEDQVEQIECINNPEDESAGTREVPFSRELYLEQDDFREEPHRKWFRLAPGSEVRLKHAYFVTCNEVIKDDTGQVVELHCSYDPESRGGKSPDGRKVKGTLHWVSAAHAVEAEVRLYDHLLQVPDPAALADGADFLSCLNPDSLQVLQGCRVEPGLVEMQSGSACQFMRQGYFCIDSVDSKPGALVFNRTVALRDSWAKLEKKL
jgi:glutaminyl-tRNA synthetase